MKAFSRKRTRHAETLGASTSGVRLQGSRSVCGNLSAAKLKRPQAKSHRLAADGKQTDTDDPFGFDSASSDDEEAPCRIADSSGGQTGTARSSASQVSLSTSPAVNAQPVQHRLKRIGSLNGRKNRSGGSQSAETVLTGPKPLDLQSGPKQIVSTAWKAGAGMTATVADPGKSEVAKASNGGRCAPASGNSTDEAAKLSAKAGVRLTQRHEPKPEVDADTHAIPLNSLPHAAGSFGSGAWPHASAEPSVSDSGCTELPKVASSDVAAFRAGQQRLLAALPAATVQPLTSSTGAAPALSGRAAGRRSGSLNSRRSPDKARTFNEQRARQSGAIAESSASVPVLVLHASGGEIMAPAEGIGGDEEDPLALPAMPQAIRTSTTEAVSLPAPTRARQSSTGQLAVVTDGTTLPQMMAFSRRAALAAQKPTQGPALQASGDAQASAAARPVATATTQPLLPMQMRTAQPAESDCRQMAQVATQAPIRQRLADSGSQRGSGGSRYGEFSSSQLAASSGSQRSSGSGNQESPDKPVAPSMSLAETQDTGESARLRDDLHYAMDGLSARLPPAAQRAAMADVADIAATQRGRAVLRSEGDIIRVLVAARSLPLARDALLAAALAATLLAFSRHAADQPVLASRDATAVLLQLLQGNRSASTDKPAAGKKGDPVAAQIAEAVEKAIKVASAPKPVPAEQSAHMCHPTCLTLLTLAGMMDPHRAPATGDAAKEAVRQGNLLPAVAHMAVAALEDLDAGPCSPAEADRLQWTVHTAMTVLETAAFAMPANEAAILAITVPATSHSAATATRDDALDEEGRDVRHGGKGGNGNGHPQPQLFPHWLTARLAAQLPSIAASQQSKQLQAWVQPGLSVLVNVTHNNAEGCAVVAAGGGARLAARLVSVLASARLASGNHSSGAGGGGDVDMLSTALGVLINLAESSPAVREELAVVPPGNSAECSNLSPSGDGAGGDLSLRSDGAGAGGCPGGEALMQLLCRLVASGKRSGEAMTPRTPISPLGGEYTAEQLDTREDAGIASIPEMYSAIVLGFLVKDSAERRAAAAAQLPGGTLEAVAALVERCLRFYMLAGALSEVNQRSLGDLVVSLRERGGVPSSTNAGLVARAAS